MTTLKNPRLMLLLCVRPSEDHAWRTREVWVVVNGERVFADKNLYLPASARKPPDGRLSLQNGSLALPLKAGKNEIAVAVANNFYGWGLILRLDDVEGIQLARQ